MNEKDLFQDKIAVRIWAHFFKNLNHTLHSLDETQKKELTLEIQDHLFASFSQQEEGSEAERLMDAIERWGDPKEVLKPLLADKHLLKASRTFNPKAVLQGLYYSIFGGALRVITSIFFFLGYVAALMFAVMAVFKPFFPNNVGILFLEDGDFVAGITLGASRVVSDPLGYWTIPLGLIVSISLYITLTRLLRLLRKKK